MSARRAAFASLGAALIAVVLVLVLADGAEPYRLRTSLDNAHGLRAGSEIRIGDVTAGKVSSVALGPRDDVLVELELDSEQAPVGRDASMAISALNLLGQKYVALDTGNPGTPAPSGFTIARSRVSTSTDLDQLLNVMDADTRTRLAILINEAGMAVTGRRADFNTLLRELPHTAAAGTRLLDELVSDNRTLGHLVDRSDAFIAQMTRERRSLTRMVAAVGETSTTFAARRRRLRATLARAPGMLESVQRFLADLRSTTVPLGPAARNITASAPAFTDTLEELEPFRRAAAPALDQARALAPSLTRLALRATPVLRRATPTVRSLATLSRELVPVTDTLDRSAHNLLAIMHNWARAIQFRDGLGHVFNGMMSVTPETLAEMIRRLNRVGPGTGSDGDARARSRRRQRGPGQRADATPPPSTETAPRRSPQPAPPAQPLPRPDQSPGSMPELLDFLLAP